MDWIDFDKDTHRCLAFVNIVMNSVFHKMKGIPRLAD
jgi:hypothetical protein